MRVPTNAALLSKDLVGFEQLMALSSSHAPLETNVILLSAQLGSARLDSTQITLHEVSSLEATLLVETNRGPDLFNLLAH